MIIAPFSGFAADEVAPEITSGPILFVLTDTVVIINWETDEDSDSIVQYGLENTEWGAFTSQENDTDLVTQHSVTITGLNSSTLYFYRVGSTDSVGNGPELNSNSTNPSKAKSFQKPCSPTLLKSTLHGGHKKCKTSTTTEN